jgi:hypothetical protein
LLAQEYTQPPTTPAEREMIMVRVFLAKDAAIASLLQVLDPGQSAKVTYRGYPHDDYVVVFDQGTNWDDDSGCDSSGITPIRDEKQERDLLSFLSTGLSVGMRVTVRGWCGEGTVETREDNLHDWDSPGTHYGIRLDDGHMVWVPEDRVKELISRVGSADHQKA